MAGILIYKNRCERSLIMKKIIFIMMILTGSLALAAQSGLAQYRYTQGNYSFTVVDEMEFDALGNKYDRELAFMEHKGGRDIATGQAGYSDYIYNQSYVTSLEDSMDYSARMARGYEVDRNYVTGQAGYDEYHYTQKNYSDVILEK